VVLSIPYVQYAIIPFPVAVEKIFATSGLVDVDKNVVVIILAPFL
jgi:hypothetical protein